MEGARKGKVVKVKRKIKGRSVPILKEIKTSIRNGPITALLMSVLLYGGETNDMEREGEV